MGDVDVADLLDPYQRYILDVTKFLFVSSVSLVIWEHLCFLPHEYSMVRRNVLAPGVLALLANRYCTLGSAFAAMAYFFMNPDCRATGWAIASFFCVQQFSVAVIFYLRTLAIWGNRRLLRYGLAVCIVAVTACWISGVLAAHCAPVPDILYGGKCPLATSLYRWRAITYISTALFDVLILSLTIAGLLGWSRRSSASSEQAPRTIRKLALSSLFYFVPVTVANVSAAFITVLVKDEGVKLIPVVYVFTVSSIGASRLIFSMQNLVGGESFSAASRRKLASLPVHRDMLPSEGSLASPHSMKQQRGEFYLSCATPRTATNLATAFPPDMAGSRVPDTPLSPSAAVSATTPLGHLDPFPPRFPSVAQILSRPDADRQTSVRRHSQAASESTPTRSLSPVSAGTDVPSSRGSYTLYLHQRLDGSTSIRMDAGDNGETHGSEV